MFRYLYITLVLVLFSCSDFNEDNSQNIAKFKDQILKKSQLTELFNKTNYKDSIIIINKLINEWAVNKILIEKAKLNLTIQDLNSLEKLVKNYKSELYSTAYLDALINSVDVSDCVPLISSPAVKVPVIVSSFNINSETSFEPI